MKYQVEITPIKALLYEILANAVDDKSPDIAMGQQMGVAMSGAVLKEKGVINIQVQNVAIKNILIKVTEALKLLDEAIESPVIEQTVVQPLVDMNTAPDLLEFKEEPKEVAPENDLELMIDQHLQGAVRLEEFLAIMAGRYVQGALAHFNNKKGVVQSHLGITNVKLNRIMKRCGIEWQR